MVVMATNHGFLLYSEFSNWNYSIQIMNFGAESERQYSILVKKIYILPIYM